MMQGLYASIDRAKDVLGGLAARPTFDAEVAELDVRARSL